MFRSTKIFDGFSCCFRQHKADYTHCRFLHGYGVSFKCIFEGDLDQRNWVWDFGGMKRAHHKIDGMNPDEYFKWLLDHTVIVAKDDPYIETFRFLDQAGIAQVRILDAVGAEKMAEHLFNKISEFINIETRGRVRLIEVEFREHGKNSASYSA